MKPKTNLERRGILKGGVLAGAAVLTAPFVQSGAAEEEPSSTPLQEPAEVKVYYSKEYGRARIQRLQEAIQKVGLDALVISNRALDYIGYVSNFHPSAFQTGVAFIPAKGPPTLYLQMYSSVHARYAKRTIWIDDVVDVPKDPVSESSSLNFYKEIVSKVKDLKLARGQIGVAGGELDWLLPHYFRSELPSLHVVDANQVLWNLVIIKDDVELALMRHSQRINDEVAYPQYQKSLRVGALDSNVYADVLYAMLKAGAYGRTTRLIFGAAPYSSGTWASGAENRLIQEGDIVLTEPIPTVRRYQTEKMFTFAMGKDFPKSQEQGAQVIYDSFLIALDELKPGRELKPIYEKCSNFIKSKGYEGSTVLIGHWIGAAGSRSSHEGARITSEGTKGLILKPGMVLSWHPNVVVPGKVRTCCSSCLLITEDGVEMMSKIPMKPMYYI